jgi:ABC-type antimicrobial peptide transport system permease subunit
MREIALRKLCGARPRDIAKLLTQEFLGLLVVGAVIGLPLAAWASESYLSGFVARAPVGPWALTLALGAAILVALFAAVRNTMRAIQISPAQAFRM